MPLKILINDKLKDKSVRELYCFIKGFQKIDWHRFYYGFGLDGEVLERRPKLGSIPTNYGCIIFPSFYYDKAKFIKYAEGRLHKDRIEGLKKKLEEEEFFDLEDEVEEDVVMEIASKHPEVVDCVDIELILPVIMGVDEIPPTLEGAATLFEKEYKRMKELVRFCKKRASLFMDLETHQWDMPYADPREVAHAMKGVAEEDVASLKDRLDEIVCDLEEPAEKGYVLILRANQSAELKLRSLEKRLGDALAPIIRHITRKTAFVTLVL